MKKIAVLIALTTLLAGCFHGAEKTAEQASEPPPPLREETNKTTEATKAKEPSATKTPAIQKRVIVMESGNLFFKPNTLTLKVNQPVTINFQNTGVHTFTVDELGVDVKLTGGRGSISFTPKKTGTFQYYCAIAGHRQAGMVGTLTVEP